MKTIAIIPARMAATRFPGKPMEEILGIPMIGHCYYRTKLSKLVDEVYVATCDKIIFNYIESIGGKAIMTSNKHERATERTAEAILNIEKMTSNYYDTIVMVQGDEPLLLPSQLDKLSSQIQNDKNSLAWNATAPLESEQELYKHSFVKCSVINSQILYCFRKSPSHNNFETQKKYIRN